MDYRHRFLEQTISEYLKIFPVLTITGARQTGKSTLLKHAFSRDWDYFSFDEAGLAQAMGDDPDLFIKNRRRNFIIDEAQKLPKIFPAVKHAVDTNPSRKIILSGSANFLLLEQVTESLAGRAGVLNLYPFSYSEILEKNAPVLINSMGTLDSMRALLDAIPVVREADYGSLIMQGGYPRVLDLPDDSSRAIWFENYRTTYLERDLRGLGQVANLSDFQKYYEMLAYQAGSLLNLSEIGRDIGITTNTSKKFLSILLSSFQYFLLEPYFININKRLVKRPKVYNGDTGLGCFLMKYRGRDELEKSGRFGKYFENWVIAEILKQISFGDRRMKPYFWRTSNGAEVDLVLEYGDRLLPFEIKSSSVIRKESLRGLSQFMHELSSRKDVPFGIVLYGGTEIFQIAEKIVAIPAASIL
jgi:uncharacterized protein